MEDFRAKATGWQQKGQHVVRCVEGDKDGSWIRAYDAFLKAEMALNAGLERGTLMPHSRSEEAFTF